MVPDRFVIHLHCCCIKCHEYIKYFIGRYKHFCLAYGQLITHTEYGITASQGHLNPYQINLRGGSVSSLEWTVIGIKVHRQDSVPCYGIDICQRCGSVMSWEQNKHEMT